MKISAIQEVYLLVLVVLFKEVIELTPQIFDMLSILKSSMDTVNLLNNFGDEELAKHGEVLGVSARVSNDLLKVLLFQVHNASINRIGISASSNRSLLSILDLTEELNNFICRHADRVESLGKLSAVVVLLLIFVLGEQFEADLGILLKDNFAVVIDPILGTS